MSLLRQKQFTKKDILINLVSNIENSLKKIAGTYALKNQLSKLKKELKRKSPKSVKIKNYLSKINEIYFDEKQWREKGKVSLLPLLSSLEKLIRGNIGLRKQPQIPAEQAKEILYCQTFHRDLSLYF